MKTNLYTAMRNRMFRACTMLFFAVILSISANAQCSCSEDFTPPTWTTLPGANWTFECGIVQVFFTAPTASDACGIATVQQLSDITIPGSCAPISYTRTITWNAIDECGNTTASVSQSITREDTFDPQIFPPGADETIECPATPEFTQPQGYDGCTNSFTNILLRGDVTTPGICPVLYTRTKTWCAIDFCGNTSSTVSQTITVMDSEAPTISQAGPDITIECSPIPQFTEPTATDGCGTATIQLLSDVTTGCSRTKTWNAIDACGNTSVTRTQTITVNDNASPVISTLTSPTFNGGFNIRCHGGCDGSATVNATDNCLSSLTYLWDNGQTTAAATGLCAGVHTVTVSDECGNSAASTITLTQPPSLTIDAGPNKIVYKGYADSSCTQLQSTISGGVAPYSRVWSTAGNSNLGSGQFLNNVCPPATRVYYLTVTDANLCTARDSVRVCVIDVRCGNNNKSVIICHGTGSATNPFVTLCVGKTEGNSHFLNHPGEQLGPCGMVKTCNWPIETRLETEGIQKGMEYIGAFPNPFSNTTTIQFTLPENDFAIVKVFDVTGRIIENLYDGETQAGEIYSVEFDGSRFNNGMYFLVMQTRSGVLQTRKLILDK
ncbi:MAG TPA: T9SS type A sorting domain-containing protein [Bacteroidia bacterium]|nr:T9SS type A sorting domain-containing protein [Bacteroidia bacterium]